MAILPALVAPLVEADKEVDEQHYVIWRTEKGVAEGSTEIPKGAVGRIIPFIIGDREPLIMENLFSVVKSDISC